jgi:hypothetical protein
LQIDDPHDQIVDAATVVASDQAEQHADRARDEHAGETDREGDPRAVDQPGQLVAAERVGAQQVGNSAIGRGCQRRLVPEQEATALGVVRSDPRGKGGRKNENRKEEGGGERVRVPGQRTKVEAPFARLRREEGGGGDCHSQGGRVAVDCPAHQ